MNINTLEKRKKDVLNKIKTEQVLQQMMKQIKQTQQHMQQMPPREAEKEEESRIEGSTKREVQSGIQTVAQKLNTEKQKIYIQCEGECGSSTI